MGRMGEIHLMVYGPKTKEGQEELARRVAEVHADAVNRRLKALNCTASEKRKLLEAVLRAVSGNSVGGYGVP